MEGSLAAFVEEKRTSSAVTDLIGAEQISRSGDSNAAGGLRRVIAGRIARTAACARAPPSIPEDEAGKKKRGRRSGEEEAGRGENGARETPPRRMA